MKSPATLLTMILLITGCANFPADTGTSEQTSSTMQPESGNEAFGDWNVNCIYDDANLATLCKAETHGTITDLQENGNQPPSPILWVSWLKGEPKENRSICVFGYDHPVTGIGLQIDDNRPIQTSAINAAGCVFADGFLIKELREGRVLVVTFLRWPWGHTKATFSLEKSINSLNELDRLVAGQ